MKNNKKQELKRKLEHKDEDNKLGQIIEEYEKRLKAAEEKRKAEKEKGEAEKELREAAKKKLEAEKAKANNYKKETSHALAYQYVSITYPGIFESYNQTTKSPEFYNFEWARAFTTSC